MDMEFQEMIRIFDKVYVGRAINFYMKDCPSPQFRRESWDKDPWKYMYDYVYVEVTSKGAELKLREKDGSTTKYQSDSNDVLADDWILVEEGLLVLDKYTKKWAKNNKHQKREE